ncbi:MAG: 50S ribosomal protein L2 [Candidatus Anstonellales archaeon]
MTKRIRSQRRGRGSKRFRSPGYRFVADIKLPEKEGKAQVIDIIDDPGRNAPLVEVMFEDFTRGYMIAPEGAAVGDVFEIGGNARPAVGNVLKLKDIPDSFYVYNIEKVRGDGGKMVRSAGSYAIILSKEGNYVYVKMPTKKILKIDGECRAAIGVVAGGGVLEAPLVKAGNSYFKFKAKGNRRWPEVRGVKMSAYNHPHGGKQHHVGKPTTVSRHAPPGSKVGHIAARRTGRRKARIQEESEEE